MNAARGLARTQNVASSVIVRRNTPPCCLSTVVPNFSHIAVARDLWLAASAMPRATIGRSGAGHKRDGVWRETGIVQKFSSAS